MDQDALPNLAQIVKQGVKSSVTLNKYNCQTPCALATQFSGILPEKNQIGGYYTPKFQKSGRGKLEYYLTFKNKNVAKNALWCKKNIRDFPVVLGQIPYSDPNQNNIKKIDGFTGMCYEAKLLYEEELEFKAVNENKICNITVFEREFQIIIDTASESKKIFLCHPGSNTKIDVYCDINTNNDVWLDELTGFKFFAFTLENGKKMFLFSNVYQYHTKGIKIDHTFREKVGVFFGVAYGKKYRNGYFGKPCYEYGNGNAERIYLCLLEEVSKSFERLNLFLLQQEAELIVSYQPAIDEVSHEFFGWWKNTQGRQKEIYWDMIKKIYQLVDEHIGKVMRYLGDEDQLVITSDHGIYEVDSIFYINEYLYRRGYLKYRQNNEIDVEESKVFYHPCNSGALFINERLKERKKILEDLREVSVKGRKIVKEIIDTNGNKVFGDYFIVPAAGINFDARRSNDFLELTNKTGCHTVNTGAESMKAIFFAKSPYLNQNDIPKEIKNTQIKDFILNMMSKEKTHD